MNDLEIFATLAEENIGNFSCVKMLINSNDGFAKINSIKHPKNQKTTTQNHMDVRIEQYRKIIDIISYYQ